MNDTIGTLGLALGSAFTAGINLYATIAALGLAAAAGAIQLPPDLQVLSHPAVIVVALVLYVVEFFADKTPYVDSTWDAVHTFIRVPAGAILAARTLGPVSSSLELIAVLAGGGVAFASHATKSSARLVINASPEPVSNWIASFAEDAAVLIGIWMIFNHPLAMLVFVLLFVVAVAWMAPRVWRGLRTLFRRAGGRYGGEPGNPAATTTAAQSRAPEGGGEVTLGGIQGG